MKGQLSKVGSDVSQHPEVPASGPHRSQPAPGSSPNTSTSQLVPLLRVVQANQPAACPLGAQGDTSKCLHCDDSLASTFIHSLTDSSHHYLTFSPVIPGTNPVSQACPAPAP